MEITITNLNDNVNRTFLEGLLRKYGPVEECCIFYHPKTKKHLGTAKVTFFEAKAARLCKEKLDNTSIMGNIVRVIEDAFGKSWWSGASFLLPNFVAPNRTCMFSLYSLSLS